MNLKEKLLSLNIVIDNSYLDFYCQLIDNNRSTKKEKSKTQKHHIIPRYYYRENNLEIDNSKENIVYLDYKDHILAHYYLCLCSNDKYRFNNQCALFFFLGKRNYTKAFYLERKEFIESLDDYTVIYQDFCKRNGELSSKRNLGKTGKHCSKETKRKISEANKGRPSKNKGKHIWSDAQRRYLSEKAKERFKNEPGTFTGKHHSLESIKSNSEKHKKMYEDKSNHPMYGRKHSEESIQKMRESHKKIVLTDEWKQHIRDNCKRRKVYCVELDKIYDSVKDASIEFGVATSSIIRCCNGKHKHCCGYCWKYID